MRVLNLVVAQSADMGALPSLYAATVPDLPGASYAGPAAAARRAGTRSSSRCPSAPRIPTTARRLWEVCEELTGVTYAW